MFDQSTSIFFQNQEENHTHSMDLDTFLLKFTSFFILIYMIFTLITGAFNKEIEDFSHDLHIINGVCEILQIVLQLSFIAILKRKENLDDSEQNMPGRQATFFLFLFNLSQWIVITFEIQKVRASKVEQGKFKVISTNQIHTPRYKHY